MENKKNYDVGVYIGRFQPFHFGHFHVVTQALRYINHLVIIIGSADAARNIKNPWTASEREDMIVAALSAYGIPDFRYTILYVADDVSEAKWIANVQKAVYESTSEGETVCLVGHEKDASSYYVRVFPQWDFVDSGLHDQSSKCLDATRIRKFFYEGDNYYIHGAVPTSVFDYMISWKNSHPEVFENLEEEYDYIERYRVAWANAPYPPTFVTTDAVVVQSGHVLLVVRKDAPGKGLLACPGGFVGQNETIENAMLRELEEETEIKLQREVLRRCIVKTQVFDSPGRSLRGRTITHASLIHLNDQKELPKINGADDASEAKWVPFSEIIGFRNKFFEDHYDIIVTMLGALPSSVN